MESSSWPRSNPVPLHWEHRVLATGPSGKSPSCTLFGWEKLYSFMPSCILSSFPFMECLLSGWHHVSDFRPKYYSLSFPWFLVFIILRLYLDTDNCQWVQLNSSIASPTTKCLETASPKGQSYTAGHQIFPNAPTQPGSERGSNEVPAYWNGSAFSGKTPRIM